MEQNGTAPDTLEERLQSLIAPLEAELAGILSEKAELSQRVARLHAQEVKLNSAIRSVRRVVGIEPPSEERPKPKQHASDSNKYLSQARLDQIMEYARMRGEEGVTAPLIKRELGLSDPSAYTGIKFLRESGLIRLAGRKPDPETGALAKT